MTSVGVNAFIETDIRLREANHRIKNSLQLACSLLRLQAMRYPDPNLKAELYQASSRIASIAKVHDRLCQTDNSRVDVAAYLRELSVRVTAAHVTAPAELAISLGLVVTELVTNALKHAYRDGVAGNIHVAFIPLEHGGWQLMIADKGVGLPEGVETADQGGLGMLFLRSLCSTLQAQMEIDRTPPGTCFTLRLPPIEQPSSSATILA